MLLHCYNVFVKLFSFPLIMRCYDFPKIYYQYVYLFNVIKTVTGGHWSRYLKNTAVLLPISGWDEKMSWLNWSIPRKWENVYGPRAYFLPKPLPPYIKPSETRVLIMPDLNLWACIFPFFLCVEHVCCNQYWWPWLWSMAL